LHRDIKPSNLLLDDTGNVWVTDFGLAKAQSDTDNLTHTGDIVGTLRYLAPERFRGQGDVRSDIYRLAGFRSARRRGGPPRATAMGLPAHADVTAARNASGSNCSAKALKLTGSSWVQRDAATQDGGTQGRLGGQNSPPSRRPAPAWSDRFSRSGLCTVRDGCGSGAADLIHKTSSQ